MEEQAILHRLPKRRIDPCKRLEMKVGPSRRIPVAHQKLKNQNKFTVLLLYYILTCKFYWLKGEYLGIFCSLRAGTGIFLPKLYNAIPEAIKIHFSPDSRCTLKAPPQRRKNLWETIITPIGRGMRKPLRRAKTIVN